MSSPAMLDDPLVRRRPYQRPAKVIPTDLDCLLSVTVVAFTLTGIEAVATEVEMV